MKFSCLHCSGHIDADDDLCDFDIKCPHCDRIVRVPTEAPAEAPTLDPPPSDEAGTADTTPPSSDQPAAQSYPQSDNGQKEKINATIERGVHAASKHFTNSTSKRKLVVAVVLISIALTVLLFRNRTPPPPFSQLDPETRAYAEAVVAYRDELQTIYLYHEAFERSAGLRSHYDSSIGPQIQAPVEIQETIRFLDNYASIGVSWEESLTLVVQSFSAAQQLNPIVLPLHRKAVPDDNFRLGVPGTGSVGAGSRQLSELYHATEQLISMLENLE